jgi:TonB family protein
MTLVLLKATLLFALALGCLRLMRRASSVSRHLVCACAMAGALLLPLTMLAPPEAAPIRLAPITFLATAGAASGGAAWPVSKVLLLLWIGGTAILLLRLAIGYWRLSSVLRTATGTGNAGFAFSDVPVPMVAGLLRPVILMPRAADGWPISQRAAALQHERAHVRRKDLWTSFVAHLTCAVYWFHPLVWVLARHLRHEQETACDDAVLCSGFEPASYAEALLATARQITSTNLIGCHMTQRTLKSRIARLFESGMPRMTSPSTLLRTAMVFAAAIAAIAMLNGSKQARAADEKVYRMSDGIASPGVIYKVEPSYTDEARAAKIAGSVLLSVVVGTDGLAHDINVVNGIDAGLDRKAVDAVQQWHFRPGTKDGQPVAVQANIEINFKLL